ncbi:MAG: hypothetical protein QM564_01015 [Bergeyella sp.]
METMVVYPKSEKQKSLLASLLDEMKIRFEIAKTEDDTKMTKEEFYAMVDAAKQEAREGKVHILTPEKQKELLGL